MQKYSKSIMVVMVLVLALLAAALSCTTPSPTASPSPTAKPPSGTTSPTATPTPTSKPTPTPTTENVTEFFRNNTADIVVPYGAGGGTDFAGRLVATFWSDATGGGSMRVKNIAGGGTLVGTNTVYKAKPDGLTLELAPFGTALAAPTLYNQQGKEFDISKFNYLGAFGQEPVVFGVNPKLGFKTLDEVRKAKGLRLSVSQVTGGPPIGAALSIYYLGLTDARIIGGFDSAPEMGLAIQRGEIDGMTYSAGTFKTYVDQGQLTPFCTIDFKRSALFPNVPTIVEVLKLSEADTSLLKTYRAAFQSARTVLTTPGVPAARVAFMQAAFAKEVALPGFVQLAKDRYGFLETPLSAKDVEDMIKEALASPKADLDKLDTLLKQYMK